jgi:hypothetical protein
MDTLNLPRVEKITSSAPLSDLESFDMMSRFLEAEKAKQLSLDFAGQSYLSASSQIWNDLRLACNSLLEENDSRRDLVAEWKMDVDFESTPTPSKSVATAKSTDKDAKRSAKQEKKEAKKAKKEKKEAKKIRKEAKKRKRE